MEGLMSFLSSEKFWMGFGFAGNAVFAGAFIIQWLASEKRKKSHIPVSFWWIRIAGSIMLLVWSAQIAMTTWDKTHQSIVLIVAYSVNCLLYVRNLVLIRQHQALVAAGLREPDKWEDA
jgi:lipid-A-disaccharide synthase-like uncharacterized protein